MYCVIQKKPISEIFDLWEVLLDFSVNKILQFYVLTESLEGFNEFYHFLSKELNLIESGEFVLKMQSTSLSNQIVSRLPLSNKNHSFVVKNFGESWNAKSEDDKNSYSGSRFGHDYDQELMESRSLKKSLNNFDGKIIIFTWVDATNSKIVRTAISSHFKSGAIKPAKLNS